MSWKDKEKEYNKEYYYNKVKNKHCPDCGKLIQIYSTKCSGCSHKKNLNKIFEKFKEKTGKVLCGCGCGREIVIKPHYRHTGVRKYISGHNPRKAIIGFYETKILDTLENILNYKILRQYRIMNYYIDGYCPTLNLAIEIDGPSHGTKGLLKEDIIRQQKIENKLRCQFLRIDVPRGDYYSRNKN